METDDILAKAATPQSEVIVQISEDPLESVKIFVKTSCPKSVELCYDCSNTIKKLAMEGQQIDTKESKDDEAIKKYGVGKCEVEINNSDFERLIKLIERNYQKKHLDGDNSTENDIDSELDRQLRSAKNLLKEESSKGKRTSNSSIVYETEYEDDEVDGDLKENCCISGTGPSQSPISVQNSKKPNLCSIIDKQTKNAGEDGCNTGGEWLSKETGDNSGEPNNSDIDSDSDKDTTFISKIPTLTPAQQQSDKEMRRLLRSSNIKILDSDDSDATVLKSDDGSDSDSDGKINCKTKSKRPIINSFDGEYCASNKESFSEDISNSNEPKKRMTAKKSHIDKNLTYSGGSKKKKRRIIYSDDDSDEKSSVADANNKVNDDEKLSKNIDRQKFASKRRLTQETREAEKAEKERRKRLEEKQREFNGIELIDDEEGNISILYGQVTTTLKSITLDPDSDSNPPMPVCVHPSLVKILKKHQAEGIQFLYNCTIESVTRLEEPGGGAILGHCMGLGKTLQIIAFLHTILTHEKITKKINKVLVVVPKNVVLNWMNEFEKWLCGETDSINYLELDSWKTHEERLKAIKRWINYDRPSVLIIGYELFRILTLTEEDKAFMKKNKRKNIPLKKKPPTSNEKKLESLRPQFCEYLRNAPHLIVCDEGHKLKSPTTGLFHTINKVKTVRRICMTGTPLQNNLEEYYCMVNFVKPNLLGKLDEFKHRFSNIIKAGRAKDASDYDVRRMRRRCHVLFDRLKCVLDWRDYSVLRNSLPPKQEYVINIRLTKLQIDLYKNYLDCRNLNEDNPGGEVGLRLIYDHIILYRIWTHPYLLIEHVKREQNKCSQSLIDDFINADEYISESESDISDDIVIMNNMNVAGDGPSTSSNQNNVFEKKSLKRIRNNLKINDNPSPSLEDWAKSLISEEDRNNFEISNKLMLLIEIIKKCEKIGDKLLVFSQFLSSIALIERMLKYITQKTGWFVDGHRALMMADGEEWGWFKGIDYGVIDGSVSMISRDQIQKDFNDPLNLRNRLLLISTRAGSLGTNLIGANRVIIFDCSWNPSHDTQSLFRVYRFGQVKPVYIYRFVAQGTMEERIYNRQVTKESIAKRVTQAAQIQRHYTSQELEEMYIFEPDILSTDNIDGQGPRLNPPKDRLLGDIILEKTDAIVSYHPHDILFDELEDEKLTDEEREEAWKDYERERAGRASQQQNVLNMEVHAQQVKIITALQQQFSGQHSQFGRDLRILFNTYVHDSIYNKCLTFKGMTPDMAMNIFRMKAFLGYFIYHVPQNLAGEMNNAEKVTRVFMEILDRALRNNEDQQIVYKNALIALRTTVLLVRNLPQCAIGITYASSLFPDLALNNENNG